MEEVYLLLGGNLGDRSSFISKAKALILKHAGTIVMESALYETEPWGTDHSPMFLNCVVKIETLLEPAGLLTKLLWIESQLGRIRTGKVNESRTIDIDILFYGNRVISTDSLQIPHPRLHLRRFALIPFNSIAPDFIHPVTHSNIARMLRDCPDQLSVNLFEPVIHLT